MRGGPSPRPAGTWSDGAVESAEAMNAALTDPEGGAAAVDVATSATGGAAMAHDDVQDATPAEPRGWPPRPGDHRCWQDDGPSARLAR